MDIITVKIFCRERTAQIKLMVRTMEQLEIVELSLQDLVVSYQISMQILRFTSGQVSALAIQTLSCFRNL